MATHEGSEPTFTGFARPEQNWFRAPYDWIDISAGITNIAELKVVQYILRHTWGFQEYGIKKHITIDEFVRGRKRRDGSRMDKGTGLSERAVRYGLADALKHGYIEEAVDDSDRARIKKFYALKMQAQLPDEDLAGPDRHDLQAEVQRLHPEVHALPPRGATFAPRTEIETSDRSLEDQSTSKIKNSFFSHSISDGELSTSLRTQSKTDGNRRRDHQHSPHPDDETAAAHLAAIRADLTKRGILHSTAPTSTDPRLTAANRLTHQPPTIPQEGSLVRTRADGLNAGGSPSPTVHGQRQQELRRRGRPPKTPPAPIIAQLITEVSREFHDDEQHIKSNITQATNLWQRSGMSESDFVHYVLYPARSTTKQQGNIRKPAAEGGGLRNKLPYFFGVVRDLAGLKSGRPA
jgi:hypothetical protein